MDDRLSQATKPSGVTLFLAGLFILAMYLAWRFYRALPDAPISDKEEPPPDDYNSPFEADREVYVINKPPEAIELEGPVDDDNRNHDGD